MPSAVTSSASSASPPRSASASRRPRAAPAAARAARGALLVVVGVVGLGDRLGGVAVVGLRAPAAAASAAPAAAPRRVVLVLVVVGRGDRSGEVGVDLVAGLDRLGRVGVVGGGRLLAGLAGDDRLDDLGLAQTAEAVDAELAGEHVKVCERAALEGVARENGHGDPPGGDAGIVRHPAALRQRPAIRRCAGDISARGGDSSPQRASSWRPARSGRHVSRRLIAARARRDARRRRPGLRRRAHHPLRSPAGQIRPPRRPRSRRGPSAATRRLAAQLVGEREV